MKKRSDVRLGGAFFGISDPGLIKKSFFEILLSKKLTGGPGDEILEIVVLWTFLWRYFKKVANTVAGMGAGSWRAGPPSHKKSRGVFEF